jgi:hypothetical protein
MMNYRSLSPAELLGPLNEVEQKNAPKTLFVTGDTTILEEGPRVSAVGAHKASDAGFVEQQSLQAAWSSAVLWS